MSFVKKLWGGVKKAAGTLWEEAEEVAESLWGGVKKAAGTLWEGVEGVAESLWGGAKKATGTLWEGVEEVAKKVVGTLLGFESKRLETERIVKAYQEAQRFAERQREERKQAFKKYHELLGKQIQEYKKGISDTLSALEGSYKQMRAALEEGLKDYIREFQGMYERYISDIEKGYGALKRDVQAAYQQRLSALEREYRDAYQKAQRVAARRGYLARDILGLSGVAEKVRGEIFEEMLTPLVQQYKQATMQITDEYLRTMRELERMQLAEKLEAKKMPFAVAEKIFESRMRAVDLQRELSNVMTQALLEAAQTESALARERLMAGLEAYGPAYVGKAEAPSWGWFFTKSLDEILKGVAYAYLRGGGIKL